MCQVKPVVVKNKNAAPPPGPSEDKDPKVPTGNKRGGGAGNPPKGNKPFRAPRKGESP